MVTGLVVKLENGDIAEVRLCLSFAMSNIAVFVFNANTLAFETDCYLQDIG